MIKTVANMLEAFIEHEVRILDAQKVKHRTTIGGMYEDLTADVLNRAIVTAQPLKVVSGFIVRPDGTDSDEMDIMLVVGEPEPIARSPKVRCRLEDVITVIQVKKTLVKNTLTEGLDNIADVRHIPPTAGKVPRDSVAAVFQHITQVPLPEDVRILPPRLEMLYHILLLARAYPSCIVLSYGGYRSHDGFRKGLLEILRERTGKIRSGPMSLPDLVLNQKFAAIKLVGQPWMHPLQGDWWPLLGTTEMRPTAAFLLESIYTKLVQRELAGDEVFGEDLEMDPLTVLVRCRFDAAKEKWEGDAFSTKGLAKGHDQPEQWSPIFLTPSQHGLVTRLCREDAVYINEPEDVGLTTDDLLYLAASGLVGRDVADPKLYRLLTRSCDTFILSDGRIVAAENNSGRLWRWLQKQKQEKGVVVDAREAWAEASRRRDTSQDS